MSRLHKKISFSLKQKYYLMMLLLILYGYYKNGFLPFYKNYSSLSDMIIVFIIPILSYGIGWIFDKLYNNQEYFNSRFFSLLFSMIIPISINILFYIIFLNGLLLFYNYLLVHKKNSCFNFIAGAKTIIIFILSVFKNCNYENFLEKSGYFKYTFINNIMGHNISSLFTSSILLILIALILFESDEYYKKEIPLYSYGIYLITVLIYAFLHKNMTFILLNTLQSNILFALVFVAPFSNYSPYRRKEKFIYSVIIGISILPFSLVSNFHNGIYFSILLANLILLLLNFCFENKFLKINNIKVQGNK